MTLFAWWIENDFPCPRSFSYNDHCLLLVQWLLLRITLRNISLPFITLRFASMVATTMTQRGYTLQTIMTRMYSVACLWSIFAVGESPMCQEWSCFMKDFLYKSQPRESHAFPNSNKTSIVTTSLYVSADNSLCFKCHGAIIILRVYSCIGQNKTKE